jgi:hypothetical protein
MADPKDVHRRVMMILGSLLLAMGLAAAYLAFSSGNLPSDLSPSSPILSLGKSGAPRFSLKPENLTA